MLLGPVWTSATLWRREIGRIARGERAALAKVVFHLIGVALVFA
jgi:hypothetical protein